MELKILLTFFFIVLLSVEGVYRPVFPTSEYQQVVDERETESEKRQVPSCSWCTYETRHFDQNIDHFNFANNKTFKQRYLINKVKWKPGSPIFFYCGNEGDVSYFARTVGLMWEFAEEFNAMVVFAEQRYQGDSLPFGKRSLDGGSFTGYLSSAQVIGDYVKLVHYIKENEKGAEESAVIAFGGSLGGQYASWMRMKYPNIIAGTIASSAPLFQYSTPCWTQYSLVTKAFEKFAGKKACVEVIRRSWNSLHNVGLTKKGRHFITNTFKLCKPLRNYYDLFKLRDKLALSYLFLSMENYPYETSSKPAWPVESVCKDIEITPKKDKELIKILAKGLYVYFNHSKHLSCLHLPRDGKEFLGAWNYQSCTEMAYPLCSDGVHDMYYRSPWDIKALSKICKRTWGAIPDPDRIKLLYGDRDISEYSNIVFSNGDIDPWSGGGILTNITPSLVAINIENGAHTYDLRFSHPKDLKSVIKARKKEKSYVKQWIGEWKEKLRTLKQRKH